MWKHGDAGWMYRTTAAYPASISLFFRNRSSSFFLSLPSPSKEESSAYSLLCAMLRPLGHSQNLTSSTTADGEPRSGRTLRSAQTGMWEISQPNTKSTSGPRDMPGTPRRRAPPQRGCCVAGPSAVDRGGMGLPPSPQPTTH